MDRKPYAIVKCVPTAQYALLAQSLRTLKSSEYSNAEAFQTMTDIMRPAFEYVMDKMSGRYGECAMTSSVVEEEDMYAAMRLAVYKTMLSFVEQDDWSDEKTASTFLLLAALKMLRAFRDEVAEAFGVSKHYAGAYVHLRVLGLDLYESDEDELLVGLKDWQPNIKNVSATLAKMRKYFAFSQVKISEASEEVGSDGSEKAIELRIALREIREIVKDDIGYNAFLARYAYKQPVKFPDLAKQYGVPTKELKERVDFVLRVAKSFLEGNEEYYSYIAIREEALAVEKARQARKAARKTAAAERAKAIEQRREARAEAKARKEAEKAAKCRGGYKTKFVRPALIADLKMDDFALEPLNRAEEEAVSYEALFI